MNCIDLRIPQGRAPLAIKHGFVSMLAQALEASGTAYAWLRCSLLDEADIVGLPVYDSEGDCVRLNPTWIQKLQREAPKRCVVMLDEFDQVNNDDVKRALLRLVESGADELPANTTFIRILG